MHIGVPCILPCCCLFSATISLSPLLAILFALVTLQQDDEGDGRPFPNIGKMIWGFFTGTGRAIGHAARGAGSKLADISQSPLTKQVAGTMLAVAGP